MTQKLDGKFYGKVFKAKNGKIVPADEWVLFLAKDNAFAAVLPLYRAECARLGADARQLAAVDALIERVNAWRAVHPDQCKVPDMAPNESLVLE